MDQPVSFSIDIEKSAPDGSFVRGWASVATQDGKPIVDWEDDVIPMRVLRTAVHNFMGGERVAKMLHEGVQAGAIVESVIIDDEFAAEHGITHSKRGWWIGMSVTDPVAKAKVVARELRSFSIGGRASKVKIPAGSLS
jgi:hypothetical protein